MPAADASEIIRSCKLFHGLTDTSLDKVTGLARAVRFKRGRIIFRQGDPCPGIYAVGSGAVRVFKIAPSGKEHVLHFAYPGTTFAEVAAIGDFDCPAFADAAEDSVCALIPQQGFRRLVDRDHAFCIEMMTGMARWVRELVGLLEDVVLRDAAARVARHLLQSDESKGKAVFTLPMRKRDLASHLNLTSETLSRTLRRFADHGLIEVDGTKLRVLDSQRLQDVADGMVPPDRPEPAL